MAVPALFLSTWVMTHLERFLASQEQKFTKRNLAGRSMSDAINGEPFPVLPSFRDLASPQENDEEEKEEELAAAHENCRKKDCEASPTPSALSSSSSSMLHIDSISGPSVGPRSCTLSNLNAMVH